MLASYADETGHGDDPKRIHLGMGGLLATSDKWEAFNKQWELLCREEGVKEPFTMKHFAARKKGTQFADVKWQDESTRQRLLEKMLGAMKDADVVPIGAIVNVPDFRTLTLDQQCRLGGPNREPYYVAFQHCTQQLAFAATSFAYPPEPVSMVYAHLKKFTGAGEGWWYAIKKHNIFGAIMSSYTPGEPRFLVDIAASRTLGHKFFEYFDKRRLLEMLGEHE